MPNPSRKSLIRKLDTVFSKFIRNRDNYKCVTCGHISQTNHAGHFISRKVMNLRFDEKNVNCQCIKCNTYNAGEQYLHAEYIKKTHGIKELEKLLEKRQISKKYTIQELQELITYYQSVK